MSIMFRFYFAILVELKAQKLKHAQCNEKAGETKVQTW